MTARAAIRLQRGRSATSIRFARPSQRGHRAARARRPVAASSAFVEHFSTSASWQDRDATGRRIQFKKYGRYKLRAWGMSGRKGASSYDNHQCCLARATLIGPGFRRALWTWGNIPRSENDRATYLRVFP